MHHRTFSWIKAAHRAAALGLIAGAAAGASAGCGGLGPGDYVIYRVAVSNEKAGKDCEIDDEDKDDSSTFKASDTFILYAGTEDAFFLDIGNTTLEGEEEDDGYKFSAKSVDIDVLGGTPDDKVTRINTMTVQMTVDGAAVSGKITRKTSLEYACAGPCLPNSSCTRSSEFVGSEIEDVELQHDPTGPSPN
jgi:hypothetical protein